MICSGCNNTIAPGETIVYADEGQYHIGCEFNDECENIGEQ